MRRLLWLLLVSSCYAQFQGSLPNPIDSAIDGIIGGSSGVITYPENVSTNDTLVCGIVVRHNDVYTISDSLANTWTTTSPTNTGGSGPVDNWMAYTKSGSAGADTITLTPVTVTDRAFLHCIRLSNFGAFDVFASATAAAPGGIGSINTSLITTTNNDTIVSLSGGAWFGSHTDFPNGGTEFLTQDGTASPSAQLLMTVMRTGAKGTYTPTHSTWGGSSNRAMQSLAFKPGLASASSSIFIDDTGNLPDAGNGVSYSAQLHCIGGTSTQSYTLSGGSLPSGITLTGATGVISGSSTATGNYSPQFTCTDGTVTSSPVTLPLQVGSGVLGVPNVRQVNNKWSADGGTGNFTMSVLCGSVILVYTRGDDTHGSAGWLQATSGTNNKIYDSFGSTVRRLPSPLGGNFGWAGPTFVIGPVTQSGPDTITITNNQGASSARLVSLAAEITGANVLDSGTINIATSLSASGSVSSNYTSVVPNTMILAVGDGSNTLSLGAPYAILSNGGDIEGTTVYGDAVISTASTTTSTLSWSGASTSNPSVYTIMNIPVRPSLQLASCPVTSGPGERIRRQVF